MKAGKTGNYVIEITTNSTDPYNSDYHVLLRDNARARYIEGNHIGRRRGPNLIPISRTGDKIRLWVGKIDESFIFDCIIDDERASYGSIVLRQATDDEENNWAINHIISIGNPIELDFSLTDETALTYYVTNLNGDYTLEVENVSDDMGTYADMVLVFGNKNSRGAGSASFNHHLNWSGTFNNGYMILSIWNPDETLKLNITLSSTIHHKIRYNSSTSRFECEDDGCDKYFNVWDAGDLLVGNWEMELDGGTATLYITDWGDVPIQLIKGGKIKNITGTASYNEKMEIFLDIPAPYNKHYKLESFCFGQSMTFTDGTVATMVE